MRTNGKLTQAITLGAAGVILGLLAAFLLVTRGVNSYNIGYVMGPVIGAVVCFWEARKGFADRACDGTTPALPGAEAAVWHVLVGETQTGPLSESEMTAWARGGKLRPHDMVWSPGMQGWAPAQQIQAFASAFAGAATASSS